MLMAANQPKAVTAYLLIFNCALYTTVIIAIIKIKLITIAVIVELVGALSFLFYWFLQVCLNDNNTDHKLQISERRPRSQGSSTTSGRIPVR